MKGIISNTTTVLAGLFCLMIAAYAEQMTSVEEQQAIRYLDETRQAVAEAVKGLSDAQWNFKPRPDRWSIAQIVEHMAVTEEVVEGLLQGLDQAPAPAKDRDPKKIDALILAKVPDRSARLQAPPPLVPTGRWSHEVAMQHFLAGDQAMVAFLQSGSDLREHVVDHPVLGPLDGYEWILTVAAHNARHIKQILEVKADPHFPVK